MPIGEVFGLYIGAALLGAVHGILPDHGWPVAAMYALNQRHPWVHALVAGGVLGIGHLVSSIAVVVAYFWALGYVDLAGADWLGVVAGSSSSRSESGNTAVVGTATTTSTTTGPTRLTPFR